MKLTEARLRSIINKVIQEGRSQGNISNYETMSGRQPLKPVSEDMYTDHVISCLDFIDQFEASGYDIEDFVIGLDDSMRDPYINIYFKVDCTYSLVSASLRCSLGQGEKFDASIRSVTKPMVVEVPDGSYSTRRLDLGNYYIGREFYGQYYCYDNTHRGWWQGALQRICALSEIPPQERPFKDEKTKRSREGKMLRAAYGNVTDRQFRSRPEFNGYYG